MLKTIVLAQAITLILGVLLLAFLATMLGDSPLVLFSQVQTAMRALAEPRLAAYVLAFLLYLAGLPVILALLHASGLVRAICAIVVYALMHAAFYALQFPFPLSGYEELMLILCSVVGLLWIVASTAGTLLAAWIMARHVRETNAMRG